MTKIELIATIVCYLSGIFVTNWKLKQIFYKLYPNGDWNYVKNKWKVYVISIFSWIGFISICISLFIVPINRNEE